MDDFQARLGALSQFGELVRNAAAAAANRNSPAHRAIACREIDRLGTEWLGSLANGKVLIAAALISTVHALAAASVLESRTAVSDALRALVVAARAEPALYPTSLKYPAEGISASDPARWWMDR